VRNAVLLLGLFVLVPALAAGDEVVAIRGGLEPAAVWVVESDLTRTVIEYELGGFRRASVDIGREAYYTLSMGEEGSLMERGLPGLPIVCRSIAIPDDAEMELSVISSHFVEYRDFPVAPSKGLLLRNVDPSTVPYTFDAFYGSDDWFPGELAHVREPYIMRDVRGLVVVLNPFQYNHATRTLRVYDRVTLEVSATGPGVVNVLEERPKDSSSEFLRIYPSHFINYVASRTERYDAVGEAGNMLVICYDDAAFLAAMQPLVEWKKQMGVPCEMVTSTDAGGTASAIDAYITQYYNDNGLTYVLLVGDSAQVPTVMVSGDASDPSYSTITADMYPDIIVGRFSAESASQVETQVLRTIEYERNPEPSADWYHRGTGIASDQGPGDDGEYDDEHADNIRADLLGFTYSEVDRIYDPTGTSATVTTALNSGRSVINYTGHGSTTSWGSTGFSSTNVNALTNDNMLPFIFSVACVNGDFDGPTCFAEAWLRATNGSEPTGAIGAYMSSINQSWEPPMDAQDEMNDLLVGGAKRTFGGLCYNGCGHMMDVYGSLGEDMFLTWHVFGDPSVRVRTDTPAPVTVNHIPEVVPGAATFDVEVAGVEGALCALYADGILYGSAVTDAFGEATISLSETPTVGDTLTLTVTGFNTETYIQTLPVAAAVTYDISPPSVPIGVSTPVTVTVWGDGPPLPGVAVTISGWGTGALAETTDASGEAHFSVLPPYGEALGVAGVRAGDSYSSFTDVLPVTGGTTLVSASIDAGVPSIGLTGSLAVGFEGTITGTASQSGFDLYAAGCGVDASGNSGGSSTLGLQVTPTSAGTISAVLAKAGYDIFEQDVFVEIAYGQVSGSVWETGGLPLEGALVSGYPAGSDTSSVAPIFADVTDGFGRYDAGADLEVGDYDIYARLFGFIIGLREVTVLFGANDIDFDLDPAPTGVVSGTVTESGSGLPLGATVSVYRSDNGELYAETMSSEVTGEYSVSLPYFDYGIVVSAPFHTASSRSISVSAPAGTENFTLDSVSGNVLVVVDEPTKAVDVKEDENGVPTVIPIGLPTSPRSGTEMASDLAGLGYAVTVETAVATDPGTWLTGYDLVVWSSGDNAQPVSVESYRTALESYVAGGGRLLIEGGELAYDAASYPIYPSFAADVLHISSWGVDDAGNLTVETASHPVASLPNAVGTVAFTYSGYWDQDSSVPTGDAVMTCDWSLHAGYASVIAYDDDDYEANGQIVFFSFDYLAGEEEGMVALLENAAAYLLAEESSTGIEESGLTPAAQRLRGIHPNPFNPITTVTYGVPGRTYVTLAVYDVSGRLVRTLVDGVIDGGLHEATWDGRDDRGMSVSSGVYFCRMEAGEFAESAKMVLLK
jgi:hypothetical protein